MTRIGKRFGMVLQLDDLGRIFWDGAREERLLVQRCDECGRAWHPPSHFCQHCQSVVHHWEGTSGGLVHSYAVIRHAVHPIVADWVPYVLLLVDLDAGTRIIGRLRGAGNGIGIGTRVDVAFEHYEDISLPVFVAADSTVVLE